CLLSPSFEKIKVAFSWRTLTLQVVKSKMFMAALDKTAQSGRLSRVVIDEAHCCSQV
ncbi:unnamed protein product, partial [Scytosiphon promiscuus]